MQLIKLHSIPPTQNNCCVPYALSTVLNQSFDTVNSWLKRRKYRKSDRGGTWTYGMNMSELGLTLLMLPSNITTVGRFVDSQPKGVYLIRVSGHALALKDGIIYDTSSRSSRRRIKQVWRKTEEKLPEDFIQSNVLAAYSPVKITHEEVWQKPKSSRPMGDKKQAILHYIALWEASGQKIRIKDLAIVSETSYIYARWIYNQNKPKN